MIRLHGLVPVNKPKGITSYDVVARAQREIAKAWEARYRKEFGDRGPWKRLKVGHGGTLDPMATGVLGTILSSEAYDVTALFGSATDTYDATGQVTEVGPVRHLTRTKIEIELEKFKGNGWQKPPMYSALKVAGKPLYQYARTNKPLPLDRSLVPRPINIFSIDVLSYNPVSTYKHPLSRDSTLPSPPAISPSVSFRVRCGGGTYMRSLVNDLGENLGTCAHMCDLVRLSQKDIILGKDTLELEELEDMDRIMWAMRRMLG
ncbi:pseudouridine synthase [Jimgerdemannia flammicorona]|uniref:tRNA pseudouridine(55) synthase n=1 Tax=Jimgerdemannia flammicorona TaxID=994334 RepID=A0A433QI06_9FUNG|nr:pseudouridine synthase [Jimgerdemannia flammicorona]